MLHKEDQSYYHRFKHMQNKNTFNILFTFPLQDLKIWKHMQIENEYQNVERAFGKTGPPYVRWAAQMAVGLETGVPWMMCKQDDAPDPVVSFLSSLLSSVYNKLIQVLVNMKTSNACALKMIHISICFCDVTCRSIHATARNAEKHLLDLTHQISLHSGQRIGRHCKP